MTHNQTIKMLQNHFGEVQPIKDEIIRCQKLYHDKPFQVLYLDFSNKWLDINEDEKDLEHYLENVA